MPIHYSVGGGQRKQIYHTLSSLQQQSGGRRSFKRSALQFIRLHFDGVLVRACASQIGDATTASSELCDCIEASYTACRGSQMLFYNVAGVQSEVAALAMMLNVNGVLVQLIHVNITREALVIV